MAGAGFKTFNTGDVLTASDVNTYLMQQTTMVFADASARSTALGANVAEGMISYLKDTNATEVYDGSSWVAISGDITGVTAGTGLTGGGTSGAVTLDFDVANYGGGQWAAGKNKIINGDMGIWQRGTTFTSPANGAYTADRFKLGFDGNGTCTVSRQAFTAGTAPVSGYEGTYFLRHLITSAGTTTFTQVFQPIEDVRTFAGQTVTFSFWAKAETSRSVFIYAEQNFGSGGSSTVQYLSMGNANLTTSWQRFSFTVALSSISGKTIGTASSLNFYVRNGTTLNAQLDLWGVQVEAGSTATPFQTATGTIQGELAACQRYYWRTQGNNAYSVHGISQAQSTTSLRSFITLPVTMRVIPTSIDFSTLRGVLYNVAGYAITAAALQTGDSSQQIATIDFTTSGVTANQFYGISNNNNTAGYIGVNAEL